jgi:ABC-2 type transport system permease protein
MKKTWLIIRREYLTRVRKKTFIIGTILFPALYLALIFGTGYIASKSKADLKIGIIDNSGMFTQSRIAKVNGKDSLNQLMLITTDRETFKKDYATLGYSGYIEIAKTADWKNRLDSLLLITNKTFGIGAKMPIESKLNKIWSDIKNDNLGIDSAKKAILGSGVNLELLNMQNQTANAGIATTIGYVCGFLMYIILLLYGSQVMMGVTEEKTSRIAEVVVSSVKPFQLMLGKIVGIAMVALSQFILWIAFIFIVYNIGKSTGNAGGNMAGMVGQVQQVFTSVNVLLVIGCFIFYLLGGFFFYASLYAAIGSAINEDMREAQSLSFPITMLVIFSIALMTPAITNPGSPIAVWASIIPFSSPIVMTARIPSGVPATVPWWQLGLSMALLIAGFIFTTWFAGKIYKTGILMYGKKPSYKEMIKWAFRKS